MTHSSYHPYPVALSIAGSDSSAGAGIQADLKTFAAHRVYGSTVLTLVTAQNTTGVRRVFQLPPDLVGDQLESVLADLKVKAVKTGALGTSETIAAVASVLKRYRLPLVIDPVMVAKSGDPLMSREAVETLKDELFPLATLITPNVPEAESLFALESGSLSTPAALQTFATSHRFPQALLLKAGHLHHEWLSDWLVSDGAPLKLEHRRIATDNTHGTGCTLSAAITARLAMGHTLVQAVKGAHGYLIEAIRQAPNLGKGHGPLEHFPARPGRPRSQAEAEVIS